MNYQLIEYAVRRYIDKKGYLNGKKDYNLFIKSSGYILGSYYAFVVTDAIGDDRIYEVTHLQSNPTSTAVSSYLQDDSDELFLI